MQSIEYYETQILKNIAKIEDIKGETFNNIDHYLEVLIMTKCLIKEPKIRDLLYCHNELNKLLDSIR